MWFVLCILGLMSLGQRVDGNIVEEMGKTTELCCRQGTSYARTHSSEDCSSSVPPDVPSQFGTLCIFAMDQCCKEYFQKKHDCDAGVDLASSTGSCDSAADSAKNCCAECARGKEMGLSRGVSGCTGSSNEDSADHLLAGEAFTQCCKRAASEAGHKEAEGKREKHPLSAVYLSRPTVISSVASLCEEYAPNELCAHHCIPVPGSYKCECNPGFQLMADGRNCMEVEKNRCKPKNPCQHKCNDNGVEVKCSCRRGYQLMADGKSCEDIDECKADTPLCLPFTDCYNIQGSYKCIPKKNYLPKDKGQCPPGFARNTKNNVCDDINECSLPNPPCPAYLCDNTIGGYKCGGVSGDPANLANQKPAPPPDDRCPPGFKMGYNDECEDVDECALHKDDCNPLSQYCINTRGSFYCQNKVSKHCRPGFKIDPVTNKCEDINECEDGQDICRFDQICVNVPGEYDCKPRDEYRKSQASKCPEGMRMKPGTNVCEDIDECMEGTHLCDAHQNCLNTNGSHECNCKLGYEIDPITGGCVDINECAANLHNCIDGSQRCDNTIGSFICVRFTSCGTGYTLQASTSECEDIDECAMGTHNCMHAGPDWHCENRPGTFRCVKNRKSTTSTTTPPPEYEYEYYDSDEEIDNATSKEIKSEPKPEPKTEPASTTTTTPAPTDPIPPISLDARSNVLEKKLVNLDNRNTENQSEIFKQTPEENPQPPEHKPDHPPESDLNSSESQRPENVPPEPQRPDSIESWQQPEGNQQSPQKPEGIPEIPLKNTPNYYETDNAPGNEPSPTPPQVVLVDVGKETATIEGKKEQDGSVVVDTKDVPKNKWTKVNEKPSNCRIGFEEDELGVCVDIDECASNRHSCSGLTETCRNTVGGYLCDCAEGFRRDLVSGDCHIITTPTPASTQPTPSSKSFFWGYPDLRPVTARPFRPRTLCDVGYHFNSKTGSCEDIDECHNGQANCAAVELCINTEGGYRCECPPNWRLDEARHRCLPVRSKAGMPPGYHNQPIYPPPSETELQQTFKGSKVVDPEVLNVGDSQSVISCPSGYKLGYDNACEDVDECSTGEARCFGMLCTNLPGGYVCSCPPGHRLVDGNHCEDVDECSMGGNMPICSQNADCENTIGSYQCKCHKGFRSAPVNDKVCVDVDECTESPAGSLCQHRCNNVWGGYRCSCHRGYRLNPDNSTCSDVDECMEFKSKIVCVGRCLNEPGSYRCTCPTGYRLSEDKRSCIDIDECETGEAHCATGGQYSGSSDVCLNTRGGYRCHRITCPPGYKLESRHRCTRIEKVCPLADWECAHQPTTYSYNFITFVSKLYIPESKVDLFTMRGPSWPNANMRFQLRLVNVDAPPSVNNKADINAFLLVHTGNQAVMSLVRSLEGPQSIELELSMELYNGEQFGGIAVARLYIYVSEYEF
ncbi:hypothetical protein O0L34_g13198 [Tuta absoluta]|nr:hypothetical protein O0L34_g13198 [Tuta absoluta]